MSYGRLPWGLSRLGLQIFLSILSTEFGQNQLKQSYFESIDYKRFNFAGLSSVPINVYTTSIKLTMTTLLVQYAVPETHSV